MPVDSVKTASEILMEALDEFNESEGREILLIYTNEANDVVLKTNMVKTHVIGLAEYIKESALRSIFSYKEEP